MKTTKITIGRLYNLGNYEHVRYELTAEIQESESAGTALIGLENILAALNPKKPHGVLDEHDLKNAQVRIQNVMEMSNEMVLEAHGKSKVAVLNEWQKKLDAAIERTQRWNIMQMRSRILLDDLGGAANYTDAKQKWDDNYDNDF